MAQALTAAGVSEVDTSTRRRAEYSTDASNYRVVPQAVAFPRHVDEISAAIGVARELGVPITPRGGGTSVAGNAVGTGIVLDLSRHLHRIHDLDPVARTAVVEPGVILGSLQKLAAPHGLRFGPDPSTWARATLGGMIGNNACGHRALSFGRTADNIRSLEVVDGQGRALSLGRGLDVVPGLEKLVADNLATIRTELGGFRRQISGYSLEHLLPENGRDLARAFAGTEGTLGIITRATVDLVEAPRNPVLVVIGYSDMPSAADDAPRLTRFSPMAIEGLDMRIVDAVRRARGDSAVPELPVGAGWLLLEIVGDEQETALERAARVVADANSGESRIVDGGPEAAAIWRIREDGAGLAGRTAAGRQAWPGLEDAAVPPERLGAYLRDFDVLLASHNLDGTPFGHFGDGCVHVRLDIPLETDGAALRSFMQDAAALIASHGGSLSGEHGDGRARSELLPYMYSEKAIGLFRQVKGLFDPDNILNPDIIVDPAPIDGSLRRPSAPSIPAAHGFAFAHDQGDFTMAVHRCVGVGKCRADNTASGGFMCPSFLATKDEKDSTRGRARVLQDMINGTLVEGGWSAPEVHESLDLCLSCKACSSDCPAGIDMAAYKSEVLHRTYRGKLRPISHYTLGWMPRWARLATHFSALANAALSLRLVEKVALLAGGMDTRRSIPRFARTPFRSWLRRRGPVASASAKRQVVLWADTFSDNFSPSIGIATVEVLEAAGYEVLSPPTGLCCGLTWITTGQLDAARHKLAGVLDGLHPFVERGIPVLGLEPSCTAVLRSDMLELLPNDPRAKQLADSTYTLSELLTAAEPVGPGDDWQRPDLSGVDLVVQPHCHHHSVMGFETDKHLLTALGATTTVLSGCCGLAGNFGMERGHYDVSVAVAENSLLPALREAPEGSIFLADGLSCRTQASQLGATEGIHLAELLASH
ncbi:MAG: linked oxidase domain protein [Rhodoglobus sp.]|nr:linked oxidase domain protein [Rhodoglobus sp.]